MDFLESLPAEFKTRYADAISRENLQRAVAFLSVPEAIAGYPVLPMNIRHYMILHTIGSPLICNGLPSPIDLSAFLWLLNPAYHPTIGRKEFLRSCRVFTPPMKPRFALSLTGWHKRTAKALIVAQTVIGEARQYIKDTFADASPATAKGMQKSYYCDAASLVATLSREFGWPESDIMRMPLRRIFQYVKAIKDYRVPGAKFFNASDRILQEYVNTLNTNPRTN